LAASAATGCVFALGACGGGERQDAGEPEGNFVVDVSEAKFPERQSLARQERMVIRVKNADTKAIPNVAVTVDGFSKNTEQAGVADPSRPVWIIDNGPRGGTTAYVGTWSLGRLAPGQSKEFTWKVTAVQPGSHKVTYRVAAGLDGKAKAQLKGGGVAEGAFDVRISDKPAQSRVDPDTGDVVRDTD
jgi:hypothetical protein